MRFSAEEVAAATGGVLNGPPVMVDGVSIDSRTVEPGQLFVPIVAARDGHDFIDDAMREGAAAYLTSGPMPPGPAIEVADTSKALWDLGAAARERIPGPVVGITGSVGKTSVKDMTAAVLGQHMRTTAALGSFNNELGVPITLINAPDDVHAAVIEMGARGVGHIAKLCGLARPTIGVVTKVALAHAEMFGTIEQVAVAKGEMVEALPSDGWAILNAGDERVAAMASRTSANVVTYGMREGDVHTSEIVMGPDLRPEFELISDWGRTYITLAAAGRHQVENALAAAAVALAAGVSLTEIASGLSRVEMSAHRMDLRRTSYGAWVLDDCYNANEASMAAAIKSFSTLDAHSHVAVLGEMGELGDHAADAHASVAKLAADHNIRVIAVNAPMYGSGVDHVDDIDSASDVLGPLTDGMAVLVKGSRSARLERLVAHLVG